MPSSPSVKSPRRRRGTDPAAPDLAAAPDAPAAAVDSQVQPESGAPEPGQPDAQDSPEAAADEVSPAGRPADPDAAVWEAIDGEQPGPDAEVNDDDRATEIAEQRTAAELADLRSETDPGTGAEPGPDAEPGQDPAPDADAPAPKAARAPKPPKAVKEPGLCVHGCGQRTERPQAKFVRGHDSLLAQELRAAYANGEKTAEQVREHAGLISEKFLGKMNRSIAAVDAQRAAETDAARARKALLTESHKVAAKAASR